jgi:fructokinase
MLTGLLEAGLVERLAGLSAENVDELTAALRFANGVGALTTTQRGAIPALPTRNQVLALLETNRPPTA